MGRFVKQKGIEYILSAIPMIIKDDNDIIIKFVGGHGEAQIANQIIELSLRYPNRVFMEDWMDIYQVKKEYLSSSILIMPSLYEPFGNSAIEAMACLCPVVAFPTGGLSEIIKDGVTGVLVNDCSSSSLAEKIISLLFNEQELFNMGIAARNDVMTRYNYRLVSMMYLDFIRKIL
jgi:glycosyltransferase involved in cell wall biosynthesis